MCPQKIDIENDQVSIITGDSASPGFSAQEENPSKNSIDFPTPKAEANRVFVQQAAERKEEGQAHANSVQRAGSEPSSPGAASRSLSLSETPSPTYILPPSPVAALPYQSYQQPKTNIPRSASSEAMNGRLSTSAHLRQASVPNHQSQLSVNPLMLVQKIKEHQLAEDKRLPEAQKIEQLARREQAEQQAKEKGQKAKQWAEKLRCDLVRFNALHKLYLEQLDSEIIKNELAKVASEIHLTYEKYALQVRDYDDRAKEFKEYLAVLENPQFDPTSGLWLNTFYVTGLLTTLRLNVLRAYKPIADLSKFASDFVAKTFGLLSIAIYAYEILVDGADIISGKTEFTFDDYKRIGNAVAWTLINTLTASFVTVITVHAALWAAILIEMGYTFYDLPAEILQWRKEVGAAEKELENTRIQLDKVVGAVKKLKNGVDKNINEIDKFEREQKFLESLVTKQESIVADIKKERGQTIAVATAYVIGGGLTVAATALMGAKSAIFAVTALLAGTAGIIGTGGAILLAGLILIAAISALRLGLRLYNYYKYTGERSKILKSKLIERNNILLQEAKSTSAVGLPAADISEEAKAASSSSYSGVLQCMQQAAPVAISDQPQAFTAVVAAPDANAAALPYGSMAVPVRSPSPSAVANNSQQQATSCFFASPSQPACRPVNSALMQINRIPTKAPTNAEKIEQQVPQQNVPVVLGHATKDDNDDGYGASLALLNL